MKAFLKINKARKTFVINEEIKYFQLRLPQFRKHVWYCLALLEKGTTYFAGKKKIPEETRVHGVCFQQRIM